MIDADRDSTSDEIRLPRTLPVINSEYTSPRISDARSPKFVARGHYQRHGAAAAILHILDR